MATEFPIGANTKPAIKDIDQLIAAIRKTGKEAGITEDRIEAMVNDLKRSAKEGAGAVGGIAKSLGGLDGVVKKVGAGLVAMFAVDKLIEFGRHLIKVTSDFQKYEALLKNTFGSRSAAFSAFVNIQAQAAKTNFSLNEVTQGYLKLANNGIAPTNDEMTAFFDLTNNAGKGFDMFVEAVNDAVNGEFERLKEFFIKGSKDGDKITLMFKNQKFTVDNNAQSIKNLLVQLGQLNGVAGSTAAIAGTLEGKISNFGDNVDQLVKNFGDRSSGLIGAFFDLANNAVGSLNDAMNDNVERLRDEQTELNVLVGAITDVNVPTEVRAKLLDELNLKYPDFLKNLDAEKVTNEQLKERMEDVNDQFFRKIALMAAEERFKDVQQDILDLVDDEVEARKRLELARRGIGGDDMPFEGTTPKGGAEGITAEQAQKQEILRLEEKIRDIQAERTGIQGELTERLNEYNEALGIFNSTSNDYFEAQKKIGDGADADSKRLEKLAQDVNDYLTYLSDQNLFHTREELKNWMDLRKKAEQIERENAERSADLQEYFRDLKTRKDKEAADEAVRIAEDEADQKMRAQEAFYEFSIDLIDTFLQNRAAKIDMELDKVTEQKDREIELAEGNAAAQDNIRRRYDAKERELKRQQAQRDQNIAIFNTIIQIAQGVARALGSAAPPINFILAALVGAAGGIQLSTIRNTAPRGFAKGVFDLEGPGTSTSDSIPSWLSRHESIVPADKTKKFGWLLKPIIEDNSLDVYDVKSLIDQHLPTQYRTDYYGNAKGADSPELLAELRATRRGMENLKQLHVSIDENGFQTWTRNGEKWTRHVDNRYKF